MVHSLCPHFFFSLAWIASLKNGGLHVVFVRSKKEYRVPVCQYMACSHIVS